MYTIQRHKFLLNVINDTFFNRWFEEIWLVIWQRLDFNQTFNIFILFHYIILTYIRIKWMSLMIFSGEKQLMHSSIKVNYYTRYCRWWGRCKIRSSFMPFIDQQLHHAPNGYIIIPSNDSNLAIIRFHGIPTITILYWLI